MMTTLRRILRFFIKVSVVVLMFIIFKQYFWIMRFDNQLKSNGLDSSTSVKQNDDVVDLNNQESIRSFIDKNLEESLKKDKGKGCEIPETNPFAEEVKPYNKQLSPINCTGEEWISCYMSKCKVNKKVLKNALHLKCTYRDILFYDDYTVTYGPNVTLYGDHEYTLINSDNVEVVCEDGITGHQWKHYLAGIRKLDTPKTPEGRNNSYNVLFLGFDSTSKNGFIRKMPNSLKYIQNEFKGIILEGYHVVGDGTTAALFPILTGKRELEHPDTRKTISQNKLDHKAFIFYRMKELGYRTLYMEDFGAEGPSSGTFQRRFNGFPEQPADHYIRNLLIEEYKRESNFGPKWKKTDHCHGSIPQYKYMMNLTDQFFQLPDKKFGFTFISHITHDDFNMIAEADLPLVDFLKELVKRGLTKNTLIIVMGDHGTRFGGIRNTYQGKLEERLPFIAVRLPDDLIAKRPEAEAALKKNSNGVLTTPHDIYATVMDVLDLREYWNPYKVKGADLRRGMTLLEAIPRNRSCSEAGIEPHWCACLKWERMTSDDPMYTRVAKDLVHKINIITKTFRSQCVYRTLVSIDWVVRKRPDTKMLNFIEAKDRDRYIGDFKSNFAPMPEQLYQVKITVNPGLSVFEAIVTHLVNKNETKIKPSDITRTNAYRKEPACISNDHPELNIYCYCKQNIKT